LQEAIYAVIGNGAPAGGYHGAGAFEIAGRISGAGQRDQLVAASRRTHKDPSSREEAPDGDVFPEEKAGIEPCLAGMFPAGSVAPLGDNVDHRVGK
jgi:hypothetical protein